MIKLKKGDIVDIVAPAGFSEPEVLIKAVAELKKWGLVARTFIDFTAFHPFHSDDDDIRFEDLKRALMAKDSKVIWCLRGGYGSARLLSDLKKMKKPGQKKIIIGFSDITALHSFVNQKWGWESIHGPTISTFSHKNFNKACFQELRDILFRKSKKSTFGLMPMNIVAEKNSKAISGSLIGGNLAMIQTLIGTSFEIKTSGKILILEDVNERGYRIDRLLNHLLMSGALKGCKAIIFGDFTNALEPGGESYVEFALTRFALDCKIPIYSSLEFGHGNINRPMVLNSQTIIKKETLTNFHEF
jgi:muramoyltetrapeptide carboxypeptidase